MPSPPVSPSASAFLPQANAVGLRGWLQRSPPWVFVLYVSLSSFVVYACMYGFRKPFTAASYENYTLFGMHYKVVLVIAQVIGYMLSKFLGIRIIAGMRPEKGPG
jgi:hypothetical protein